jgi:NitT/TauT family transport system ATP-binding protein
MDATVAEQLVYTGSRVSIELQGAEGPHRVLEDMSFHVRMGEILSILGPSGTGKTTLLRALSGLIKCAVGSELLYHGSPLLGPPEGVVLVFQDYTSSLLPWRTVERNVSLGIEGRVGKAERHERIYSALELVGLAERARAYPNELSGGMQQRVQLARALAVRPQVLLMDEPFGSLDAMTKAQLQDELQTLQGVTGATVVFVTHDIEEAIYLSDRLVVLTGTPGRLQGDYTVDLPRPRSQLETREDARFLKLRHHVFDAIRGETGA